jgi:hypothetical protein
MPGKNISLHPEKKCCGINPWKVVKCNIKLSLAPKEFIILFPWFSS